MDSSCGIRQALQGSQRGVSASQELLLLHLLQLLRVTLVLPSSRFEQPDAPSPVQFQRARVLGCAFYFYSFLSLPCYNRFWAFTLLFFLSDFLVYFRLFFFGGTPFKPFVA